MQVNNKIKPTLASGQVYRLTNEDVRLPPLFTKEFLQITARWCC